jgi:hypothetical protein
VRLTITLEPNTVHLLRPPDRYRTASLKDVPFELIRAGLVTIPARPRRARAPGNQLALHWEKPLSAAIGAGGNV